MPSAIQETRAPGRRFVNYRDMSVQQLGSIYERLLEREPARDDAGKINIRAQSLRPQGQRQLLHSPGARRSDRRSHPETACRGAPEEIRGKVRRSSRATAGPNPNVGPTCSSWIRPRRSST